MKKIFYVIITVAVLMVVSCEQKAKTPAEVALENYKAVLEKMIAFDGDSAELWALDNEYSDAFKEFKMHVYESEYDEKIVEDMDSLFQVAGKRASLHFTVMDFNATCPKKEGVGVILENVSYNSSGNIFKFNYLVDTESMLMIGKEKLLANIDSFVKTMMEEKQWLNRTLGILEDVVRAKATLVYHLHTEGGEFTDIEFTPSEIEEILIRYEVD